jgi:hypothetical protein
MHSILLARLTEKVASALVSATAMGPREGKVSRKTSGRHPEFSERIEQP